MLGLEWGSLNSYGFTGQRIVDMPCGRPNSDQGYELGHELALPAWQRNGSRW
jgi:hypothetical protein